MSFTENPRSALCSAGVCCGTCGVEAELEAYAPLVRSVAWRYAGRSPSHPPPPSPTARKNIKPERRCAAPVYVLPFLRRFCLFALALAALCVVLLAFLYS